MLKGEKINLRTIRQKDLPQFLELMSDIGSRGEFYPLMMPTETSLKQRYDKDGFWEENNGHLLVVDKESDRILGLIVFFRGVHYYDGYEIGYLVFEAQERGKGIMSDALNVLVSYLVRAKPIHRLQLQIEPGNLPSQRVAEKGGFSFEGLARGALNIGGRPRDIGVYSLLRSEFEARG